MITGEDLETGHSCPDDLVLLGIEHDGARDRGQEPEHFYRLVHIVPAVVIPEDGPDPGPDAGNPPRPGRLPRK